MAIGDNFRSADVLQGMPLGMTNTQIYLTADDTVIDPTGYSLIYVGSNNTTATNRTFTILASPLVGHVLTLVFYTGASTTAQLVDSGAMRLGSNWTPVQYDLLQLVSDGTNWLEMTRGPTAISAGAVDTAELADDAVTTAKILDANVTLAKLASGITPSHVVKYGATYTTTGGAAAEPITVNGVAATDLVTVQIRDNGTNNVTLLQAVPTLNTITLTFSGDPGADCIVNYVVFRAAS